MPVQLTSPSGVAGPRALPVRDPGPGSRTGTTYPETVRLDRSQGQRLTMLVSWPGSVPTNLGRDGWRTPITCCGCELFTFQPLSLGPEASP